MDAIAYPIGNSLYLNITNRCTNRCPFCVRYKSRDFNQKYQLWLDKEPSVEEIIKAVGDPSLYKQIVFCGYGEPTIRLDVIKEVSRKLKADSRAQNTGIRIDTNGTANLFWNRNILPELQGLIDFISISLNAENAEVYDQICHSFYGQAAYPAVLDFIREARKYIPETEATVVDLPTVDKEKARALTAIMGVKFRIRPYYEEIYVK